MKAIIAFLGVLTVSWTVFGQEVDNGILYNPNCTLRITVQSPWYHEVIKPVVLKSEDQTRLVFSTKGHGQASLVFDNDGSVRVSIEAAHDKNDIYKVIRVNVDPNDIEAEFSLENRQEWNLSCPKKGMR